MIDLKSHVMIDLETLATGNDAIILSIGAVKFDPNAETFEVLDSFHQAVHPTQPGRKFDGETFLWRLDEQRRQALFDLAAMERVTLDEALDGFASWFGAEPLECWGNGAVFDLPIMRHAFSTVLGREPPWKFWDENCYRTIKKIAPHIRPDRGHGIAHNALHDAIYQAQQMHSILKWRSISL